MENLFVVFHIGRGGRFNNGGFKKFYNEQPFYQLVDSLRDKLFIQNRINGKFCKPFIHDGNGRSLTNDDWQNGLTGQLDFDGDYDSFIVKHISDCNEIELEKIKDSHEFNFVSEVLKDYVNNSLELA